MATGLARQGYQAEYHGTAIVPVILGNPTVAHAGYLRLMRSGVYVNPVAPQPCRRSVRDSAPAT